MLGLEEQYLHEAGAGRNPPPVSCPRSLGPSSWCEGSGDTSPCTVFCLPCRSSADLQGNNDSLMIFNSYTYGFGAQKLQVSNWAPITPTDQVPQYDARYRNRICQFIDKFSYYIRISLV